MTIVCCDGAYIAADSCSISNHSRIKMYASKIQTRDGYTFALAGHRSMLEPLMNWYLAGADPDKYPPGSRDTAEWSFVVFFADAALTYEDGCAHPNFRHYPIAIGSGMRFAQAIMHDNGTALRAAQVAADLDINCAHPVQVVDVPEMFLEGNHPPKPKPKSKKTRVRKSHFRRR